MAVSLSEIKEVVSLASCVLRLGEGWYHASNALEEFKSKVTKLERNYEAWQRRARNFGLSTESTLRSLLQEAKEQLRREEARLRSLDCGCGCLCLYLSCGTEFPAQLGKSIVDLDGIISSWRADDDAEDAARKRAQALARAPKFGFQRDHRYVRIPVVEEELKSILNSGGAGDDDVRVVLLHGRAGSGKSSMARNLALDYQEEAISAADGCASNSSNGYCEFDDVLYMECGPEANLKAKKVELLGMLRWKRAYDSEKDPIEDELMLEQLLKERRSLIIFDDVWEGKFLKNMVGVCGKHMKILVTSQKKYLCTDSLIERTQSISMDRIATDDSVRILKVHTGFEEKDDIPEAVKEYMDDLVAKVCGHPHALASVAVAIDANHKTQTWQWESAVLEYDQLLEDPLSKSVMNPLHDVQYERSFMEAIQVKFRRLSEEERKLMVLMAMLEGPSVPEDLLRLFYGEIIQNKFEGVGSPRSFSKARKRLEDLQCIKSGEYRSEQTQQVWSQDEQCSEWGGRMETKGLSWSIHSLDDQYIHKNMFNEIELTLDVVNHLADKVQGLEVEPQVNVTKLLGFLFFKSPFYQAIQSSLPPLFLDGRKHTSVRKDTVGRKHTSVMLLFLISLMAKPIGGDWSRTSRKSSYQMFSSVLVDGNIHNNAAEELLKSSISKHRLWTLMRWWRWELGKVWSISLNVIIGVLRIFGDLHSFVDTSVVVSLTPDQWNSLLVLVSRRYLLPAKHRVFQMENLVLGLFDILKSPCCLQRIKHLSAVVLTYLIPLMYEIPSKYGQEGLASVPIVIEQLVHSLQEYSDWEVRKGARVALCALAWHSNSDVKQKMTNSGFFQLLDSWKREEDDGTVLEIVKCLAFGNPWGRFDYGRVQNLLSASMVEHLKTFLIKVIEDHSSPYYHDQSSRSQNCAVEMLMAIDLARVKNMTLHSCAALQARGAKLVSLGQYQGGSSDLENALQLSSARFYEHDKLIWAKVQLKDWEGALKILDLKSAGKDYDAFFFLPHFYKERGFFKRMMGNLPGALEDLNKAYNMHEDFGFRNPDEALCGILYEVLKQRGYVKFLMGDEEGARVDAGEAQQFKPSPSGLDNFSGVSIVEFLNFRL